MAIRETFTSNFRKSRLQRGLPQEEVAQLAGIHDSLIVIK
jgi:transcriptional regulator with XRE-family HTH domain